MDARQLGAALGLVALAASAAYAGNLLGVRDRLTGATVPEARAPAVSRVADGVETSAPATGDASSPAATRVRSQPWWQQVATLRGSGPATHEVEIVEDAIQWRVRWSCGAGELTVTEPGNDAPLVDAACPGDDAAFGVHTGRTTLEVRASGPWELVVEQQRDVPLEERPDPRMAAETTRSLATGTFYDLDQVGRGRVTLYQFEDGTRTLRLDDFYVTPNVDLELRLSPLEAPASTEEYLSADSTHVAPLPVTAGSMNLGVPADVELADYRSLVVWCPPLRLAYAAATLELTEDTT